MTTPQFALSDYPCSCPPASLDHAVTGQATPQPNRYKALNDRLDVSGLRARIRSISDRT
jgi:hypothetical protein